MNKPILNRASLSSISRAARSGATQLIPKDPKSALEVRLMDRFFDNYVMTPMQRIVADSLRAASDRDPLGVREARSTLDSAYGSGWMV